MNIKRVITGILSLASLVILLSGCEYDVKTPLWYDDYTNPPVPVISRIEPANIAGPGVQKITIYGENFSATAARNFVYFDKTQAELLNSTTTSITVRRPAIISDSAVIKVASGDAVQVVKYSPYKITSVWSNFGDFLGNPTIAGIAVDNAENVYIVQNITTPRTIYKITPDGIKTNLGESTRNVTEIFVGPGNKLYILMNYRRINQVDLNSGENIEYVDIGKTVSFGDFDRHGIMYVGGSKSDLFVVDTNKNKKAVGVYALYNILGIRVFEDYVYVLATHTRPGNGDVTTGIWKHKINDTAGTLAAGELVLDWATTGAYAASTPYGFTFTQDGNMLIATDYSQPIMILGRDGSIDYLYKDILPTYAANIEWGTGNFLYMLLDGEARTLVRIDMGAPGAPYYGRQ
ncbi:MAG TPA: IPT/TIG domain-containing protein [bacterium]|nr:IPT/TIG domain-containing protein [bacterium]HPN45650.1 IPT/TIG domain-containing protein [bacterium]